VVGRLVAYEGPERTSSSRTFLALGIPIRVSGKDPIAMPPNLLRSRSTVAVAPPANAQSSCPITPMGEEAATMT
jgi:hypothetical protein